MQRMTVKFLGCLLVITGLLFPTGSVQAKAAPPPEGGKLPEINLPAPSRLEEQQYLGVAGKAQFKLPEIQAELVIIEIFSMYCPHCQKEAPTINELYRIIEQDKALKGKIKLIGLGVGNTLFEVNTFRNAYTVPFPLLPDPDFMIHKAMGEVRTPYFIVIKNNKDGSHRVVYSKVGSIGDSHDFLKLIDK